MVHVDTNTAKEVFFSQNPGKEVSYSLDKGVSHSHSSPVKQFEVT